MVDLLNFKTELFYLVKTDVNGNILGRNPSFNSKFGSICTNMTDFQFYNAQHVEDHKKVNDVIQEFIKNPEKPFSIRLRIADRKNDFFYSKWEISTYIDSTSQTPLIQWIGFDSTYTEIKYRDAKNGFAEIARMNSHETRAPLARILGLLEIIKKENLCPFNDQLFTLLKASAMELDQYIRKISLLSYRK